MKIGVVVDGDAESQALKLILRKIEIPRRQLLGPAFARMHPDSPVRQIARRAIDQFKVLKSRGAERFIVLIDCETPERCPPEFAGSIARALDAKGWRNVDVVVKRLTFENWLIADVEALKEMKARWKVTKSFQQKVSPNKADNVSDPTAELNKIAKKGLAYRKRKDGLLIAERQQPLRIAANSRSFRRFLRVAGHPDYESQSRKP